MSELPPHSIRDEIAADVTAFAAGRNDGPATIAALVTHFEIHVAAELRRAAHDFARKWPVYGDEWLRDRAESIHPTTPRMEQS